jgi:hypothetical protein
MIAPARAPLAASAEPAQSQQIARDVAEPAPEDPEACKCASAPAGSNWASTAGPIPSCTSNAAAALAPDDRPPLGPSPDKPDSAPGQPVETPEGAKGTAADLDDSMPEEMLLLVGFLGVDEDGGDGPARPTPTPRQEQSCPPGFPGPGDILPSLSAARR